MSRIRPWLLIVVIAAIVAAYFLAANVGQRNEKPADNDQDRRTTKKAATRHEPVEREWEEEEPGVQEEGSASEPESAAVDPEEKGTVLLSGRVLDWEGNPVAHAEVAYARDSGPGAVTDENGTFALRFSEPGQYRSLTVKAFGLEQEMKGPYVAPSSDVVLSLEPHPQIKGRVVDKLTGKPVKSFEVKIWSEGGSWLEENLVKVPDSKDGRFLLFTRWEGVFVVCVGTEEYVLWSTKGVRALLDFESEELAVELVRGTTVTLRVTSAEKNEPLGAVSIWAKIQMLSEGDDPAQAKFLKFKTDASGTCILDHLPAGEHTFVVESSDYARKKVSVILEEDEEEKLVEVELDPGLKVRGLVLAKADGGAVAGAKVRLGWQFETTTDEVGGFTVSHVPQGEYDLWVTHEAHPDFRDSFELVESFDDELFVEMSEFGRVAGTVKNADGTLAEGVRVTLYQNLYQVSIHESPIYRAYSDTTGADGTFVLENIPPGNHLLQARGEGFNRSWAQHGDEVGFQKDVAVAEGETTHVDVEFSGHAVYGTVSVNGRLTSWREISWDWFRPRGAPRRSDMITDKDGRYYVGGLESGTLTIEISGVPNTYTVRVGDEDVRFDIELDVGAVSGTVLMPDGERAEHFSVKIPPFPEGARHVVVRYLWGFSGVAGDIGDDGTFTFAEVPPGQYMLAVRKDGYPDRVVKIEKVAGVDISGLVIVLEEKARVIARVVTDDGTTPREVDFVAFDDDGLCAGSERRVLEAKTGRCVIQGLAPGHYTLFAKNPDYATARQAVTVVEGEETQIEFTLTKGHLIKVTVKDHLGEPVPGAPITLASTDLLPLPVSAPVLSMPVTDQDGVTTLEHIADSDYILRVRREGYEDAEVAVRLAGKDAEITVTLTPSGE